LFPTTEKKQQHLRLHCVICKALFESRDGLLDHMKERHSAEAAGPAFWNGVAGSGGDEVAWPCATAPDEDGLSEDERDLLKYWREHSD
jgi:hypothetical protein